MKKKKFSTISTFLGPFFEFFRKSHFFQDASISACRSNDIRNPLIESYKKNLKVLPLQFIAGDTLNTVFFGKFLYII
jgi:hypothetical protein